MENDYLQMTVQNLKQWIVNTKRLFKLNKEKVLTRKITDFLPSEKVTTDNSRREGKLKNNTITRNTLEITRQNNRAKIIGTDNSNHHFIDQINNNKQPNDRTNHTITETVPNLLHINISTGTIK